MIQDTNELFTVINQLTEVKNAYDSKVQELIGKYSEEEQAELLKYVLAYTNGNITLSGKALTRAANSTPLAQLAEKVYLAIVESPNSGKAALLAKLENVEIERRWYSIMEVLHQQGLIIQLGEKRGAVYKAA